jgi:hypothetical protein
MGAFFTSAKATLCGVIVDIGSGSIAASIVLSDHQKELPEIIYTHREFMAIRSTDGLVENVRAMRRALFSVMLDVEQNGMKALHTRERRMSVNRIVVSCTAPWSETITQIIHFAQDTPFTVTRHMIDEIITHAYEKEEAHAGEHTKKLKESGKHIVEKTIIDITLNGYSIPDPYNKEASEIAVAHVRGLVFTPILTALEGVEKYIPNIFSVRIHTSSLILYCVFRDLYPKIKSALIVDISGEATEIGLVHDGILYESIAVPQGMNSLIRNIAHVSKMIPEEVRGYLRGYTEKVLAATQKKMLAQGQKDYMHSLEPIFQELSLRYVLPRTIFLILDQNMEHFFTETIHNALSERKGHGHSTIIPLSPERARNLVAASGDIVVDPRLALTARFFHKLHACGEIDSTR